jgi:hypothetical protein
VQDEILSAKGVSVQQSALLRQSLFHHALLRRRILAFEEAELNRWYACAGIDGGGSVRVPAALCGVVGLRPTVGRTSPRNCPDNAFSIMAIGAHTGCIADAALVYAAIANAGGCAWLLCMMMSPCACAECGCAPATDGRAPCLGVAAV